MAPWETGTWGWRSAADSRWARRVTVQVYDAEPADGVTPTQTLTLTVGEDSEVAFAEALADAREDAAFLRIEVGEQTRTIDLPEASDQADERVLRGGRDDALGFAPRLVGLETGDVVRAVFYAGDPAEGAAELANLSFTYGESSAIGFRQAFAEAAAEADVVVVTTPPTERVVDLTATAERPFLRGRRPGRH